MTETTDQEIQIVDIEPQLVIGVRKSGPYALIKSLLGELYQYAGSQNAAFAGPPTYVCHECSAEAAKEADAKGAADIEIAAPIAAPVAQTETMKCYELPGGRMAKTMHIGPYEECESTYNSLFAWIGANGYEITGPIRERYLNDPHEVPPEQIMTEILAPVTERG